MKPKYNWRYYVATLLEPKTTPFHTEDGTLVTDEMLAEWEARAAQGDLSRFDGPVTYGPPSDPPSVGRPRLADEELEVISFKVPKSMGLLIKKATEQLGSSRSSFLREAALEKAVATLERR